MNSTYPEDHNDALTAFFMRSARLPLLRPSEERALGRATAKGDKGARNRLVEHNLRLAIKIAKGYRGRGVPFEDLIQECVVGLHRAADKFDVEKGFRFSTYATWWCQHFAQRAVQNKSQNIRVPWQVQVRRAKILRYLDDNPDSTPQQLANVAECTVEQVREATNVARTILSLDISTGEDGEDSPHSLIADESSPPPDEVPETDPRLAAALALLAPDEQRVLKLRFGFDGPVRSRKEIAEYLNLDERAISRCQREAMRKLRATMSRTDGAGLLGHRTPPSSSSAALDASTPVCSRAGPPQRLG